MSSIQWESVLYIKDKFTQKMGVVPTILYVGHKTWADLLQDLRPEQKVWGVEDRPRVNGLNVFIVNDEVHLNVG